MFDFGRFVARGGQIHSAGGRLHGVASSVSTGGANGFFLSRGIRIGERVEVRGHPQRS